MVTSKTARARTEVEKARLKLIEQQAKLKELEARQTEFENMDIVDIVRGMSIPLDDLAAILQSLKSAVIPAEPTSGQLDPKSGNRKQQPEITDGKGDTENDETGEDNEE